MSAGNGSYQKTDNNGAYEAIGNGNGHGHSGSSNKWMKGAGVLAILLGAFFYLTHPPAGAATDAAVKKAALPTSGKTGKLKLFDSNRKWAMLSVLLALCPKVSSNIHTNEFDGFSCFRLFSSNLSPFT